MSTAGGGAAAVIVDIMANASQLGQTLQQAEQQIATSSAKMGKSIDGAMQQAEKAAKQTGDRIGQSLENAMASPASGKGLGRIGQMFQGRGAMIGNIATQFATSLTDDIKSQVESRGDLGDSLGKGLRESLKAIPHWSVQLGLVLADALTPVGERAGEALGNAIYVGANKEFVEANAGYVEGTEYSIKDYLGDVAANRTTRSVGRGVRRMANENLILGRMDELAALQAEQQILQMTDKRGQMMQSRMHLGLAEVQTSMGTFRTALGTPEEASARVYDAATKQLVALERIESIVKEIGHYSRTAMRN
jgi:hypothetical protein